MTNKKQEPIEGPSISWKTDLIKKYIKKFGLNKTIEIIYQQGILRKNYIKNFIKLLAK